ncbi:nitrite reductase [Nocardioides aurantiacus]|uniref:nitrite reductase n=1 Tax=Nocardioides aurantiacus TaxID=86796 RepID=UPI00403FB0BA
MSASRTRADRCPGALRPWQAADGLLVRLRLIGGRVPATGLSSLVEVAEEYGDGRVHTTSRANLQVRAFPGSEGRLSSEALAALERTGLLPTRTHELARNVMVSPQTGLAGGRADLRAVAREFDDRLCADPDLATLPGRFLFVLDDGRGDLLARSCDLGLVALDSTWAQLRIGTGWGATVPLAEAAGRIAELAHEFVVRRGRGPGAAWHVSELAEPLAVPRAPDPGLPDPAEPLPFGAVPGGRHVEVFETGLDRQVIEDLTAAVDHVIVTPWRGVLIPEETR